MTRAAILRRYLARAWADARRHISDAQAMRHNPTVAAMYARCALRARAEAHIIMREMHHG